MWVIRVIIEATSEEADGAAEAIARALCPDDDHEGECTVPWTTIRSRLDGDEAAEWRAMLRDDGRAAADT